MRYRKRLVLLCLILGNIVEQPTPEVTLEQGTLRGRISSDNGIFEYLGIPYATANATNRFKAPFPPPKWEGILNAIDEHHRCPQMMGRKIPAGEEDCLKLNIFAPDYASELRPVPVMVYIHGGAFSEGSSSRLLYDPVNFVKLGVIVVTLNYRLGALGFLCLGLEGAPGNAGLKDQLAALRWVKNNIKAFGGDPDNVTLFGESAGAASASHLRFSNSSKGLFQRVIIQSGSSLPIWAISGDPIGVASRFIEDLGYYTKDRNELMEIYQNVELQDLIRVNIPMKKGSIKRSPVWFIPCIETKIDGVERVIDEPPYEKLSSGNYHSIPSILGYNDREGIFLVSGENETTLREKDEMEGQHNIPTDIRFDIDRDDLGRQLKCLYFSCKTLNESNILDLADAYTDQFFAVPITFEAEMVSRNSKTPQYNYIFKYSGKKNIMKSISGFANEPGATHADELFYMFKTNLHPYPINKQDAVIVKQLTTMWTNFAKYGNPTPTTTDLLPVQWTPSDSTSLNFLHIDREMYVKPLKKDIRMNFWNDTYTKYRRKFYEVGVNTPPEFYWV